MLCSVALLAVWWGAYGSHRAGTMVNCLERSYEILLRREYSYYTDNYLINILKIRIYTYISFTGFLYENYNILCVILQSCKIGHLNIFPNI